LFQLFSIDEGQVEVALDGQTQKLAGPCVITIMPLAVHGFHWTSDVRGSVFTILEPHLRQLLSGEDALRDTVLRSRGAAIASGRRAALRSAVEGLLDEVTQLAPWRGVAIDAALMRLAVALARSLPQPEGDLGAAGNRAQQHVQRFRTLVEERFRDQPTLAEFAAEIGITTTQLNRVCRSVVGHPALAVLHARICLEAQRELAYNTTLSVKHIAYKLGFSDAGYFTRFFERETGATPSAWRARARP